MHMGVSIMDNRAEQTVLYKEVMGNYPTGVTVVTAFDRHKRPVGLTVNSFTSVSIEPLLILWSIDKRARSYDDFMKVDKFSVNLLGADQADLCTLFSSKVDDRFSQCDWKKSNLNLPILPSALAILQCRTFKRVEAGDHMIIIGEVLDIQNKGTEPLLYHKRIVGGIPRQFYS